MKFLINANIAYLLVVTAVMLLLLTINGSKSVWPKAVMAICFLAVAYEFLYLKVNPWAFLVVALSPLPFFIAVRQRPVHLAPLAATILMFAVGSVFLFVDQNGQPAVRFAAFLSIISSSILWIYIDRMRNIEGARLSNDPGSVVGLIGEVRTDIEAHSAGLVLVEGELWLARSKEPIQAGSTVRVIRQDGFYLTVKDTKELIKQ